MPTLAESPALNIRLQSAVVSILSGIDALADVTITEAVTDDSIATPFISVSSSRARERIYNSGVYEFDVGIHLKTTMGDGPKALSDSDFVAVDAGIEEAIWGESAIDLAAAINSNGSFIKCFSTIGHRSEPVAFDETKREILYSFTAICATASE